MSGAMAAGDSGVPAFPARDIPGSGDLRTNGWLAILLVALVAVIPLPLGGNRPAVVAAAGCYVFAVEPGTPCGSAVAGMRCGLVWRGCGCPRCWVRGWWSMSSFRRSHLGRWYG
jgi:hypothetical protein